MSISLILFFLSLLGIIFMVGRKLTLMRNGSIVELENSHPFVPDVEKIKEVISQNTKRHSYTVTVVVIRSYVRFGNFLKSGYEQVKLRTKRLYKNTPSSETPEKQEISKFLKVISAYKHKIRDIKHRIIEEEKHNKI